MISSQLMGGLGNQLFQISAALALALEINKDAVFSYGSHFLPLQGNKSLYYKNNILSKVNLIEDSSFYQNLVLYEEPFYSFKEIPKVDNLLLKGYFQSEKYFIKYENTIRQIFRESPEITKIINEKYNNINFKNSTSIHVRRGDYLKFPNVHPICSLSYYEKALSLLSDVDQILVFSDDIEWCKQNFIFNQPNNILFIENEIDYIEFYLMSRCKNNIIANSSFSWWAAWLNSNEDKKIIAPNKWIGINGPSDTHDLIPSSWTTIKE